ncbi:F-box only protein 38-like [Lingula anatina]|uniref:F-box only protein 38-like n=1 Tax=Lingula anatina TaxID=7574 RepID=A0A2R2MK24_LINAN|nr:F-box only protein 38-like [Lingula anatina]|eukprot:XP_023930540.1 F-box only protein 38-like [Lingula anatina]
MARGRRKIGSSKRKTIELGRRRSVDMGTHNTGNGDQEDETTPARRQSKRFKSDSESIPLEFENYDGEDNLNKLSLEILCQILNYLPFYDMMKLQVLSRKLYKAVSMNLRLTTFIDFTEGEDQGWLPEKLTDSKLGKLLARCPELITINGLHPKLLARRRQMGVDVLSVPGIISVLDNCPNLMYLETCDIRLLEAVVESIPGVIIENFKNRDGCYPIPSFNRLSLPTNPSITSLHLSGVILPELPSMECLQSLYLQWVRLTNPHPFKDFVAPSLRVFVMRNCAGPRNALKYVPMVTSLAAAHQLQRLELVRVPYLGGLIQHVVEDSWRSYGFSNLKKIAFGTCKHALEGDLGHLVITCSENLEELLLQPSLTKDSVFAALSLADVVFPNFKTLHLGFVDDFPEPGKWTNGQLVAHGLADITENPPNITDLGLRTAGRVFPSMQFLTIYNCPLLQNALAWFDLALVPWNNLRELYLRRCHSVKLDSFCKLLPLLQSIESVTLEMMFREPPKGCSRVGLTAGTGLGVSAALVSNHDPVVPHNAANQNVAVPMVPPNPPPPANPAPAQPANQPGAQPSGQSANPDLAQPASHSVSQPVDPSSGPPSTSQSSSSSQSSSQLATQPSASSCHVDHGVQANGGLSVSSNDENNVVFHDDDDGDDVGDEILSPPPSFSTASSSQLSETENCEFDPREGSKDLEQEPVDATRQRGIDGVNVGTGELRTKISEPVAGKGCSGIGGLHSETSSNETDESLSSDLHIQTESGPVRNTSDSCSKCICSQSSNKSSISKPEMDSKDSIDTESTCTGNVRADSDVLYQEGDTDMIQNGGASPLQAQRVVQSKSAVNALSSTGLVNKETKWQSITAETNGENPTLDNEPPPKKFKHSDVKHSGGYGERSVATSSSGRTPLGVETLKTPEYKGDDVTVENSETHADVRVNKKQLDSDENFECLKTNNLRMCNSQDLTSGACDVDSTESSKGNDQKDSDQNCGEDLPAHVYCASCGSPASVKTKETHGSLSEKEASTPSRKGKSLMGRKKGLVKKSASSRGGDSSSSGSQNSLSCDVNYERDHSLNSSQAVYSDSDENVEKGLAENCDREIEIDSDQVSQSCQATMSEIREEAKKQGGHSTTGSTVGKSSLNGTTNTPIGGSSNAQKSRQSSFQNKTSSSQSSPGESPGFRVLRSGRLINCNFGTQTTCLPLATFDGSSSPHKQENQSSANNSIDISPSISADCPEPALPLLVRNGPLTRSAAAHLRTPLCSRGSQTNISYLAKAGSRKTMMVDQSTSTSDPVQEDDHVQILTIRSATLINLNLHKVGITDLHVADCPSLSSLNGSACRVLKNVTIQKAPCLQQVKFAQCKKLNHKNLVTEVSNITPEDHRTVFIRPMVEVGYLSCEVGVIDSTYLVIL